MNHLEKEILDIIRKKYKKEYNGGLEVTKLSSGGYKLVLHLGTSDKRPIEISADLNERDFIKFIEQELVNRQLHRVQWFRGVKTHE